MKASSSRLGSLFARLALPCLLGFGLAACGGGGGSGEEEEVGSDRVFYNFDEAGGSIARNSSFDGLHGTLIGVLRSEGHSGQAVDFTAQAGSHVLFDICCNDDVIVEFPENAITLAMWLRPASANPDPDSSRQILGGTGGGIQSFMLEIKEDRVEFLLCQPNTAGPFFSIVRSVSALPEQQWTHVAVVYDGSTAVLYVNGLEDSRTSISTPVSRVYNDLILSFPGRVDDLFMSSAALTRDQVQALMAGAWEAPAATVPPKALFRRSAAP
ncbi:hypothetical protein C3942_19315 [Solimonas fluminis]|uniref:LamG-like jellyroll fold domain-containing protein n=1 Tax=Solimonas fluminis TaxID=2086571 RepID=A0A2S5TBN3_9GAMM|nr:LamG domain-containing protein [Solimonas fluminis]PPE72257.1 hypothetical protein C3942_19315 [Solimonas fluminis]